MPVPPYHHTSHHRSLAKTAASFFRHFAADSPTQPACLTRTPLVLQSLHAREHATGPLALFRVTFRALSRVARQVFHEFAGAMFIVFAVYGVLAAWRQWKTRPVLWLIGFAIVYALMMTIFGLVSFRRARRVR